jgi:hypothetical protein
MSMSISTSSLGIRNISRELRKGSESGNNGTCNSGPYLLLLEITEV